MRRSVMAAPAALIVGICVSLGAAPASAARSAQPYDFDGNGHPDLVVGAPDMQIQGVRAAGAVLVLAASSRGLSLHAQLISQSSPGVPGASEQGDEFGTSIASADFNRDGYADLAIGTPGESVGRRQVAGSVTVVYGTRRGLDTSRSVSIARPGGPVASAGWGTSLVAGDFTVDGYPDLAVGTPNDNSGPVRVLPGGASGLRTAGVRVLRPQGGASQGATRFGSALASGDLDGDGHTDLVVGARGDDVESGSTNGSVSYCAGTVGGPSACRRLVNGDDYAGLSDLAVGNMSGGALPEIVVGVPYNGGDRSEPADDPGHVRVLELKAGPSITVAGLTTITQNSAGVPGTDEDRDFFGSRVSLGDLDQDGYADLVVSAPGEDSARGGVTVVHGAPTGWRTSGNCSYSQNTPGVPGVAEAGDDFGSAVSLFDHDGDGHLDLTVGAAGENEGAGVISTLRGSPGCGFSTAGSRTSGLSTLGYPHQPVAGFGRVLGHRS